jgi:hypothetical protein
MLQAWLKGFDRFSEPSVDAQRAIGGFRQELESALKSNTEDREVISKMLSELAIQEQRIMRIPSTSASSA